MTLQRGKGAEGEEKAKPSLPPTIKQIWRHFECNEKSYKKNFPR